MSKDVSLETIRAARDRIRDEIYHSPCPYSLSLSRLTGCEIYCKMESLQVTGSFKERGARNKLKQLTESQKKAGVVAASAGNHALALAYHGRELGIAVTVVMPKYAPLVKVSNCRSFGANVVLHGDSFQQAKDHALAIVEEKRLVYVQGFDDEEIIAGAGTLGLEILEDVPDLDAVIVPIGGGGLIAGVGTAVKGLKSNVRVIGVEPKNAPTMHDSIKRGVVMRVQTLPTLADGLAVGEAGKLCLDITRRVMDELVMLDEVQIATAILRLLELEKTVVEGAGATPLAGAMVRAAELKGKKVVLVLAGGNIDVNIISRIIERGLAADGRLCRVTAYVSDRPGSLARLLSIIAGTGASIKEVHHDRNFGPADIARVAISCTMETRDFQHVEEIHQALRETGIEFD
jgi:threonine dehydratase